MSARSAAAAVLESAMKRQTIDVTLSPRAAAMVKKANEGFGIAQTQLVQRVLEWFADLDADLRHVIMFEGLSDETKLAVLEREIERLQRRGNEQQPADDV